MATFGNNDAIYWPPEINKCPDYWTYKADGKCHRNDEVTDPFVGDVTEAQLLEKCEEMKATGILGKVLIIYAKCFFYLLII